MEPVTVRKQNVVERVLSTLSPRYRVANAAAREVESLVERGYGASRSAAAQTRIDGSWAPGVAGTLKGLSPYVTRKTRARSQQYDRDHVLYSALLSRSVDFCVGRGHALQATTPDEDWNNRAEALWRDYWKRPEVTGLTGVEVERDAWRSWKRDGDAGSILLGDGRIQLIDADQLQTPDGKSNDYRFFDGVEVDNTGRPVRFHVSVRSQNPSDRYSRDTEPVEARDFVWLPNTKRRADVRGTPAMAAAFPLLDQIDGYIEAGIVAARMSACFGIISRTAKPATGYGAVDKTTKDSDGVSRPRINMEPGIFRFEQHADELTQVDPKQPGQQFEPIVRTLIRLASLEMGFPMEIAVLDFSTSNYSRAKAAMNQAIRSAEPQQEIFIRRFLSRIYQWRISKWIKDGRLPRNDQAWNHRFIPHPWQFLDPIKDVQGKMLEVAAGFNTVGDVVMASGRDPLVVERKRAEEVARQKALGIPVLVPSGVQEIAIDGGTDGEGQNTQE